MSIRENATQYEETHIGYSRFLCMQDLLHISDCARIPRPIMTFLVEAELVATSADIRLISTDDVTIIQDLYEEKYADDPDRLRIWTRITIGRFKYLIECVNPLTTDFLLEIYFQ